MQNSREKVASDLEKLKDKLLCGIKPELLDPTITALADVVAKVTRAIQGKSDDSMKGMSVADATKALVNAVKALDGAARLRSFAAGGPDQRAEAPQFVLRIVAPGMEVKAEEEEKSE